MLMGMGKDVCVGDTIYSTSGFQCLQHLEHILYGQEGTMVYVGCVDLTLSKVGVGLGSHFTIGCLVCWW